MEVKLCNNYYTRQGHGFTIFATNATNTQQGGMALAWHTTRTHWILEGTCMVMANTISMMLVSGMQCWLLIGSYMSPNFGQTFLKWWPSRLNTATTHASQSSYLVTSMLTLGMIPANKLWPSPPWHSTWEWPTSSIIFPSENNARTPPLDPPNSTMVSFGSLGSQDTDLQCQSIGTPPLPQQPIATASNHSHHGWIETQCHLPATIGASWMTNGIQLPALLLGLHLLPGCSATSRWQHWSTRCHNNQNYVCYAKPSGRRSIMTGPFDYRWWVMRSRHI